ncbi:MAG: efflux transporter outer membrane subunit [Methylococcaceae bacterium]|jgi:NodT family efflux transporter outer membrane factor (OMF) lipoprotein
MRYPLLLKLLAVCLLVGTSACSVGPDYIKPSFNEIPVDFKEVKDWTLAKPRDHELTGNWWEMFNDAYLNALEQQVVIGNQSIAQAEAQFHQAQTLVQSAKAAYFPTLTTTTSANRFRAASGQSVAVAGVRNLFSFVASFAWEPDIWGQVRRQVEANQANAQASAANLQALILLTQATLAQDYFQIRALDAQKSLLLETTNAFVKTLNITQNQYAVGVVSKADVVQAETQLQSAKAQAINTGILRSQLEHAVAVLIGKTPAELSIPVANLNAAIPPIPVNLPSQLLERRPDIAAAERLTAAANAQIGVAKSAYYPSLNLAAQNGYQATKFNSFLNNAVRFWALGPAALAIPIFDGGARGSQLENTLQSYDASVAAYRQTVLTGFQEVEDSLASLRILQEQMLAQEQAAQAARTAVELVTNQYKAGTVSYLNVMVAQTNALSNQKTVVDLQSQRLTAAVQLIKALGGGWDIAQLPKSSEVGGKIKWSQFLPVPIK